MAAEVATGRYPCVHGWGLGSRSVAKGRACSHCWEKVSLPEREVCLIYLFKYFDLTCKTASSTLTVIEFAVPRDCSVNGANVAIDRVPMKPGSSSTQNEHTCHAEGAALLSVYTHLPRERRRTC